MHCVYGAPCRLEIATGRLTGRFVTRGSRQPCEAYLLSTRLDEKLLAIVLSTRLDENLEIKAVRALFALRGWSGGGGLGVGL